MAAQKKHRDTAGNIFVPPAGVGRRRHQENEPCPLASPLHTGLHTWYVGARTAPATNCGSTDVRVPPTCRRLPPDFALFPTAIGIRCHLAGGTHQTARSRPISDDTLGGRVKCRSEERPVG